MDPVTAFSLAVNIAQFLDFALRIASKGHKLHNSVDGKLVEHRELESAAQTLIVLNKQVVESFKNSSASNAKLDRLLKQLCIDCNETASELVGLLDRLQLKGRRGKWQSYRQALKTVRHKTEIQQLVSRLDGYRRLLDSTLLTSIRKQIDAQQESRVSHPRKASACILPWGYGVKQWHVELIDKIDESDMTVSEQTKLAVFSSDFSRCVSREQQRVHAFQLRGTLKFPDMRDRNTRITEAHSKTFTWVFEEANENTTRPWSNFTNWLRNDGSVYWVTGKPGSGKSTLMKYMCKDPRTRQALLAWAGNLPLVTASFYFWNSGSELQMSQVGLFRTLFFEVLQQLPRLATRLFPKRMELLALCGDDSTPWTLSELKKAFDILIECSGDEKFKLCLFVDGLDEFCGTHGELIDQFIKAVGNDNIKACLASRPWTVFEDAFRTSPSLMLQDLTYQDIVDFTTEKLDRNAGFELLRRAEPEYASTLITNIAKKSAGVFLWVTLVVQSLLKGLTNGDRISDLQRRLEQLPDDLEELYQKMFDSIEPFNIRHASQLFQIAREAKGALSAIAFSFADEEDSTLALTTPIKSLDEEVLASRYAMIKRRLNSRCKGFLEIPMEPSDDYEDGKLDLPESFQNMSFEVRANPGQSVFSPSTTSSRSLNIREAKVAYLHRTARDFLESKNIQTRLLELTDSNFQPTVAIFRASILCLKSIPTQALALSMSSYEESNYIWRSVLLCMASATKVEKGTGNASVELLDEVERTAAQLFQSNIQDSIFTPHWTTRRPNTHGESGFLALAAEFHLSLYIRAKIERGTEIFSSDPGRPLLHYVIVEYKTYRSLCEVENEASVPVPSLSLISHLLKAGADPNEIYKGMSVWEHVLSISMTASKTIPSQDSEVSELEHWADIVEIFIRYDADPLPNKDSPVASRIREAFGQHLPIKARELEKVLKSKARRRSKLGKFFMPRLKPVPPPRLEDITPLPKLNALRKAEISDIAYREHYFSSPGAPLSKAEKRAQATQSSHVSAAESSSMEEVLRDAGPGEYPSPSNYHGASYYADPRGSGRHVDRISDQEGQYERPHGMHGDMSGYGVPDMHPEYRPSTGYQQYPPSRAYQQYPPPPRGYPAYPPPGGYYDPDPHVYNQPDPREYRQYSRQGTHMAPSPPLRYMEYARSGGSYGASPRNYHHPDPMGHEQLPQRAYQEYPSGQRGYPGYPPPGGSYSLEPEAYHEPDPREYTQPLRPDSYQPPNPGGYHTARHPQLHPPGYPQANPRGPSQADPFGASYATYDEDESSSEQEEDRAPRFPDEAARR